MYTNHQPFENIVPVEVDIDTLRTIYNYVVIEYDPKENERTASGIYTPTLSQVDHVAHFANRKGIVVKLPKRLYFDKKNPSKSMRWKTEIELEIGDEVVVNFSTINDYKLTCRGKHYRIIQYDDIVVAKRGDQIIPINGYILCKPVFIESKVLAYMKPIRQDDQGIVAYMGKPNQDYIMGDYVSHGKTVYRSDPEGLSVGDHVVFHKKAIKYLRILEYDIFRKLDGKEYIVAQRHQVGAILGSENS